MTVSECKYPSCDNEVGQQPESRQYKHRSFCSVECEVKHDHIKADARDAKRAERQENGPE